MQLVAIKVKLKETVLQKWQINGKTNSSPYIYIIHTRFEVVEHASNGSPPTYLTTT